MVFENYYADEAAEGPLQPPTSIVSSVVPRAAVPGLSLLKAAPPARGATTAGAHEQRLPSIEATAMKPGEQLNFWGQPYTPTEPTPTEHQPEPLQETNFWGQLYKDVVEPLAAGTTAVQEQPERPVTYLWMPDMPKQVRRPLVTPKPVVYEYTPETTESGDAAPAATETVVAAAPAAPTASRGSSPGRSAPAQVVSLDDMDEDHGEAAVPSRADDGMPLELEVDELEADPAPMPTREPGRPGQTPPIVPRLGLPGFSHNGVNLGKPCETHIDNLVSARLSSPRRLRAGGPPSSPYKAKPVRTVSVQADAPSPCIEDQTLQLINDLSSQVDKFLSKGLSCNACEADQQEMEIPITFYHDEHSDDFVAANGWKPLKKKDAFDDVISEPFLRQREPWQGSWWVSDELPKDEDLRLKRQTELHSARTTRGMQSGASQLLGGAERSQCLKVREGRPCNPTTDVAPIFIDDELASARAHQEPVRQASRPASPKRNPTSPQGGFMSSVSSWFSSAFSAGAAAPAHKGPPEPAEAEAVEPSAQAAAPAPAAEARAPQVPAAEVEEPTAPSGGLENAEDASPAPEASPSTSPRRRRSGGAQDGKSVLGPSTAMSSSVAGLLGSMKPKPKAKGAAAGEAKSVLGGSTAMSSSAAGALGALVAKKPAAGPAAADDGAGEEAPADARTPTPARANARRKAAQDGKSVLGASSVGMNSSAASLLGGFAAAKPRPRRPSASSSEEEQKPLPDVAEDQAYKEAPAPAGDSEAAPVIAPAPKKRPGAKKKVDGRSVISGMNSSSSSAAGALLGSLVKK